MDVDDALVARARMGDAQALDDLLRQVRPQIVRRCARILPHPHDAEEAAQEALLSVASRLSDFDGRGSFGGWVSAITTNQARTTYRTLKRRFAEQHVDVVESPDPRRTSVIAGSRLDLLDAVEALESRHPETVEAFVLRDLGSLPYDDIAAQTDTPLGTVKARIHTAREFVRGHLS